MKEKEIKLIKDLYQHFQPQTEVTDELINSCYNQYGSIRGVLMNLILKFQPNADVSDKYLDSKLAEYGLITLQSTNPNLGDNIAMQKQSIETKSPNSVSENTSSMSPDNKTEVNNNNNVFYIISGALALLSSFMINSSLGIAGIIGGILGVGIMGGIPAGIIYIFYRKNFLKTFSICCIVISLLAIIGNQA